MVVCGIHHMYNVIVAGMLSAEKGVNIRKPIASAAKPGVKTGETESMENCLRLKIYKNYYKLRRKENAEV